MAKVIVPFRDRVTWVAYRVGDDYDGPPERVRTLQDGGFLQSGLDIVCDEKTPENVSPELLKGNLDALTVTQLKALAKERGLAVPSRATKKQLVEILGG
jgi:hypothetical protein